MAKLNDYLYPLYEAHVRLHCDGFSLHADGFPSGPDSVPVPERCRTGLCNIYSLLENMVPALTCISVMGIWTYGAQFPFCAMDLWVQTGDDGFYLPMRSAAALFCEQGIPYYHHPASRN